MAAILSANGYQGVNLGATAILSGNVLKYNSTTNGTPAQIVYTVTGQAEFGQLLRGTTIIPTNGTFTQQELNTGSIRFRSDPNGIVPFLYLKATVKDLSDPSKPPLNITIQLRISIPPMPPSGTTSPLYVGMDKSKAASESNINYDDVNNPGERQQIIHEVQVLPMYGSLTLNGKKMAVGTKFTQDDVAKGNITYTHNSKISREAKEDHLIFSTRDLQNNYTPDIGDLLIIILLVDLPLQVIKNGPLQVDQGATGNITNELLKSFDEDDQALTITYTVLILPKFGQLKLNGSALAVNATFTQADIDAGKLSYTHDGSTSAKDEFKYKVAHTKDTIANPPAFPILIKVIPNLPPVVNVTPVQVDFGKSKPVDGSNANIADPEGIPDDKITITITELPAVGDLLIAGAKAKVGDVITYKQLKDGSLAYKSHGVDKTKLSDVIKTVVSDGPNKVNMNIPVVIKVIVDKPPYLVNNKSVKVERTSDTSVKRDELDFQDDDTTADKVFLTILSLPTLGKLYLDGKLATVGSKIALDKYKEGSVRYVAENVDRTAMEDFFTFKLNDDNNVVEPLRFDFKFPKLPVGCPEFKGSIAQCPKLRTVILTEKEFSVTDAEVPAEKLFIQVQGFGKYGYLAKNGNRMPLGSSFLMSDIKQGSISYVNTILSEEADAIQVGIDNGGCLIGPLINVEFLTSLRLVTINTLYTSKAATKALTGGSESGDQQLVNVLYVSKDFPNPAEIRYTTGSRGLKNGEMVLNGAPFTFCTQADINAGSVAYVHDGSSTPKDEWNFEVTDGVESLLGTMPIEIELPDEPPILINNGMLLGALSCLGLSSMMLFARDAVSGPDRLVFTVTEKVKYGTLTKGGVELAVGDTFTVLDISSGNVQYCHTDEEQIEDFFNFTLVDQGGNELQGKFIIKIIPPPPPELSNNPLKMKVCTKATVRTVHLDIAHRPKRIDPVDVIFTIKSLPEKVKILMAEDVEAQVGDTFTLDDIKSGKIKVRHPDMDPGTYNFDFNVKNAEFEFDGNFKIIAEAGMNPPWVCVNTGMTVKEKSTKVVDLETLQMCDVDLDSDPIALYPSLASVSLRELEPNDTFYFSTTPNTTVNLILRVMEGSVVMEIKDIAGKVIYTSGCKTTAQITNFKIPDNVFEVGITISDGCANSTPAKWSLGTV